MKRFKSPRQDAAADAFAIKFVRYRFVPSTGEQVLDAAAFALS